MPVATPARGAVQGGSMFVCRGRSRLRLVVGACVLAALPGAIAGTSAYAQASDPPIGPTLEDVHNTPTNAVAGNVTFLDNVRGVSGYSGLNFITYDQYKTDFMFANGTGGLAVWS